MKTIRLASHAARASAHDHLARFVLGAVVTGLGAALWLAEVARTLAG